jgi:hypothetical protein
VAPKGYEDRSSVVVARDEDEARDKARLHPAIKEITDAGGRLLVMDIQKGLAPYGFLITVTKMGMYH